MMRSRLAPRVNTEHIPVFTPVKSDSVKSRLHWSNPKVWPVATATFRSQVMFGQDILAPWPKHGNGEGGLILNFMYICTAQLLDVLF